MTALPRLRSAARHVALDALAARESFRARSSEPLLRPRVHLLYLHGVPGAEMASFLELIDELALTHQFIAHREAVRRIATGEVDRPYMSISFDDGFASNLMVGHELALRGISACFFVTTQFIGTTDVNDARRFFGTSVGVDEGAMTWGDVERLVEEGHEIGNHTRVHPNLSRLTEQQVYDEIEGAAVDLQEHLGARPAHFAWPYGRFIHASAEVPRVVSQTGHTSCASAERGAHVSRAADVNTMPCLRRDHVMSSWPNRHSKYFIRAGARAAKNQNSEFPERWTS